MTMYSMTDAQYQMVYDLLSFTLACMLSCTMLLWFKARTMSPSFKMPVFISGLVTFIAAYHYIRIFNSWVDAYKYLVPTGTPAQYPASGAYPAPGITGVPFNDAYRYMDWLLTVPLLLIEILLVMNISKAEQKKKSWQLGLASALMIISGYHGETIVSGNLTPRWVCFAISMVFFLFVFYTLLVGLGNAVESERSHRVGNLIKQAQWITFVSWLTYPIVYLLPMVSPSADKAVVGIQMGYCISDIISKCGVGILIMRISDEKSEAEKAALSSGRELHQFEVETEDDDDEGGLC